MLGGRITVLFGENSFEKTSQLASLKKQAEDSNFLIENLSAENLTEEDLLNAICGVSLLAEKRLVIVKNLSENSAIWSNLGAMIERISSDVHLCLVEEKIDKRSAIYKALNKIADMREAKSLTPRDAKNLAEFARKLAKDSGFSLDLKTAKFLVEWVGLNEWKVRDAVERLGLFGEFSSEKIREFIPQNQEGSAFGIFESAMSGDFESVIREISKLKTLEGVNGAYLFFGLVSSQFFNLATLKIGKSSGKTTAEIAKEIGANAWVLGKLEKLARDVSQDSLKKIAQSFAETDEKLKTSGANPWDLIEALLLEAGQISKGE